MDEAAKLELGRPGPHRARTVTIVSSRRGAFVRALYWAWNHAPRSLRRLALRLADPSVLVSLALATLGIAFVTAHCYWELSEEIDRRLKSHVFDNSARILSSPFAISIGDGLSTKELTRYLESAGYSSKPDPKQVSRQSWFTVRNGAVEVAQGSPASSATVQAVRIEIDRTDRISSLIDLRSGQRLSRTTLAPRLLASVKEGDRRKAIEVQFSDIPPALVDAVVAAEDRRFFKHHGIDWRGISRALWIDLRQGNIVEGGSTITQQLVKNAFLTPERSWSRKIRESAMALILESRLSKEQILALYCNEVYLGNRRMFAIHGFAQGAQVYFDKKLDELTLSECAFLAGLISAPNRYAAHRNLSQAIVRRNQVLDAMTETGSISVEAAEDAKRESLTRKRNSTQDDWGMSYFVDYAQRFIEDRYGVESIGTPAALYTTLDTRLQRAAYESVSRNTERLDLLLARRARKRPALPRVQAALVALDPHSGDVLAMIGGRSYDESQLNRATDAWRQPGSAFKPFVYAAALNERRYTTATLLPDRPQDFIYDQGRAEYRPSDYGGGFSNRNVSLAEAFTRSMNVPAVDLAQRVGVAAVASLAEQCGLAKPDLYPSMALGTSEVTLIDLAASYSVFANGGIVVRPKPLTEMFRLGANVGEQIQTTSARALSPQVAFLMTDLMAAVVNQGTASRARAMGLKGDASGKTGTSRDGWFVGYTANLVCAVWVGFDDNSDLDLKGSESALPIWVDFMKQALAIHPELGGKFNPPSGLTTASIDPTTGLLASDDCSRSVRALFITGTEPLETCNHNLSNYDMFEVEDSNQPELTVDQEDLSGRVSWEVCAETGLLPSAECHTLRRMSIDLKDFPIPVCRPELHRKETQVPREQR
jgi:penicillin-binding protein 1B